MNHSGSSFILHPSSFPGRYTFCCTFPVLADGGRYPPPCPVEPGLSSPRRTNACSEAAPAAYRAATVRPTCRLFLIIDDRSRAKGSQVGKGGGPFPSLPVVARGSIPPIYRRAPFGHRATP